MKRIILFLAILLSITCNAFASPKHIEIQLDKNNVTIDGLAMGCSEQEFLKAFPRATRDSFGEETLKGRYNRIYEIKPILATLMLVPGSTNSDDSIDIAFDAKDKASFFFKDGKLETFDFNSNFYRTDNLEVHVMEFLLASGMGKKQFTGAFNASDLAGEIAHFYSYDLGNTTIGPFFVYPYYTQRNIRIHFNARKK